MIYRLLSNLLGLASAFASVSTFLLLYVLQARSFGESFFWTIVVGGGLFALSTYFDRRDARWYGRPPTRILPTQQSLVNFVFVCAFLVWFGLFLAIIASGVLLLPSGDSWPLASLRLLYFLSAIVLGWAFVYITCFTTQNYLRDYIYLDWADTIGPAMSLTAMIRRLVNSMTWFDLVVMAAGATFLLLGGFSWLDSVLPDPVEGQSRRSRRLLIRIHWLAEHPHTIRLFAGAFLVSVLSAWSARRSCSAPRSRLVNKIENPKGGGNP